MYWGSLLCEYDFWHIPSIGKTLFKYVTNSGLTAYLLTALGVALR